MPRLTLLFLVLVSFFGVISQYSAAQESKKPEPLTEGEIIRLLQGGVSSDRVENLARERGITFEVTPAVERDLSEAGAGDKLIRTLKELTPHTETGEPQKGTTKPSTPGAEGTLLIAVDVRSKIMLDGVEIGEFSADAPRRIAASKGEHLVQATSIDDPSVRVDWTGKVEGAEQVVVLLKLADKSAAASKARADAAREAAEKERLKPLQPYQGILGKWTMHSESTPGERPCRFVSITTNTYEFRPEGLQGGELRGSGVEHSEVKNTDGNRFCTQASIDIALKMDLTLVPQSDPGVYQLRATTTGCSGTCKYVTLGKTEESILRVQSPTVLVNPGVGEFQKSPE